MLRAKFDWKFSEIKFSDVRRLFTGSGRSPTLAEVQVLNQFFRETLPTPLTSWGCAELEETGCKWHTHVGLIVDVELPEDHWTFYMLEPFSNKLMTLDEWRSWLTPGEKRRNQERIYGLREEIEYVEGHLFSSILKPIMDYLTDNTGKVLEHLKVLDGEIEAYGEVERGNAIAAPFHQKRSSMLGD